MYVTIFGQRLLVDIAVIPEAVLAMGLGIALGIWIAKVNKTNRGGES